MTDEELTVDIPVDADIIAEEEITEPIQEIEPDFSNQQIEIIVPIQEPVEPTEDEIIAERIKELKYKVAIGTATSTEKTDLKLLIW